MNEIDKELVNVSDITKTTYFQNLLKKYGNSKQNQINLSLMAKDIIEALNLPENNDDEKPTYIEVEEIKKQKNKSGEWVEVKRKQKVFSLNEKQVERFKEVIESNIQKNLITMRKSVFQMNKAILNFRLFKNFKATPQEISEYIKELLKEGIDTTFLYNDAKPFDINFWDIQTKELLSKSNFFKSDIANQFKDTNFAIDKEKGTYYQIGDYLPYDFINYDANEMYASWMGLSVLTNIANQGDIKNLAFFSRSSNGGALSLINKALEHNKEKDKKESQNFLNTQKELLEKYGIYTTHIDKETFEKKVMEVLGIDKSTLNKLLSYQDEKLIYSPNGKNIDFISSQELKGYDKNLMFLLGLIPSASSLTNIVLGSKKGSCELNANDVVKKIKELTNDDETIERFVIGRIGEKVNENINSIDLAAYNKLTNQEKIEELKKVNYLDEDYSDKMKYLNYGTYTEPITIKHFNYKDKTNILQEKRSMSVSKVFDVPLLTMNFDGMTLDTNEETKQREIKDIVEVKSTSKDFAYLTTKELQNEFLNSYYLQTMMYGNVIQPKDIMVLYHLNGKEYANKFKKVILDKEKWYDKDFIPTMKEFYKKWIEKLNKLSPVLTPQLANIDKQIELLRPLVNDTKFAYFVASINSVRDIYNTKKNLIKDTEIELEEI